MQLVEDGPIIPNELLKAHSEGRVVFFCGAGVSMARTHLGDFYALAKDVVDFLRVPPDSPILKLLDSIKKFEKDIGVTGVVSVDRVFGLLEREFSILDIEQAVAKALKHSDDVDLSAHKTMIDLAKNPQGHIRLVTTNFDRLFLFSFPESNVYVPPDLPRLGESTVFDGVVHLHGLVTEDYSGAENRFVLSSSEFGRAYLAEGWATNFFKDILTEYVVVFVGYSADDAPVSYLLEALGKVGSNNIYAFHDNSAADNWHSKGVRSISYSSENNHCLLWETLECWVRMTTQPDRWAEIICDLSQKSPSSLTPLQREHVANFVSSKEGAKCFSEFDPAPPAEWLCVFDSNVRYGKIGHVGWPDETNTKIDPFSIYGLSSDENPVTVEAFAESRVPECAWDAFISDVDEEEKEPFVSSIYSVAPPPLSSRVRSLVNWLCEQVNDPDCIWWITGKRQIHPYLRWLLARSVNQKEELSKEVFETWGKLFTSWDAPDVDKNHELYKLESVTSKIGWRRFHVRQWEELTKPELIVSQDIMHRTVSPSYGVTDKISRFLSFDVNYLCDLCLKLVPYEYLPDIVKSFRKNLEYAIQLEEEAGGYRLRMLKPMNPGPDDSEPLADSFDGFLSKFRGVFNRLVEADVDAAHSEVMIWDLLSEFVFKWLMVWACAKKSFLSGEKTGEFLCSLSREFFWSSQIERDLLLCICERWDELSENHRCKIEEMLLCGREQWDGEEDSQYINWRAHNILSRISWLKNEGCNFQFDFEEEIEKLRVEAFDWKPEYASTAVESMGVKIGSVIEDSNCSLLLNIPLSEVLDKAKSMSGRIGNSFKRAVPFKGLIQERPVRAISAITAYGKEKEFPTWAWNDLLNCEVIKDRSDRYIILLTGRMLQLSISDFKKIAYPASSWFRDCSVRLFSINKDYYHQLFDVFIKVLPLLEESELSALVRKENIVDWGTEALNSIAGHVTQALFNDPRIKDKSSDNWQDEWLILVNKLITLDGDNCRYCLVFVAHSLDWLHSMNEEWTEKNLLSFLSKGSSEDVEAFWSGVLWNKYFVSKDLLNKLKPNLIDFVLHTVKAGHKDSRNLAAYVLYAWSEMDPDGNKIISDDELRSLLLKVDDNFRSHVLWQLGRWGDDDSIDREKWGALEMSFLEQVWPKQITIRTPKTSEALLAFAVSSVDNFCDKAKVIIPMLGPVSRYHFYPISGLLKDVDPRLLDEYSTFVLEIMRKVLPEDASGWPYELSMLIEKLETTAVVDDPYFQALKRKWESR